MAPPPKVESNAAAALEPGAVGGSAAALSGERAPAPDAADVQFQRLAGVIAAYDPSLDGPGLERVYRFAKAAHGPQLRKSGDPYIVHPIEVAEILAGYRLDAASISAALLHDTVEDTGVALSEIATRFGGPVAELVDGVTKLSQISKARGASKQAENLQKFVLAIATDIRVLLIKLADRLHNMRTLEHVGNSEKQVRIAQETLDIYAPLARRIGMHRLCVELEDLAFRWINPAMFQSITRRLDALSAAAGDSVAEVSAAVAERLEAVGIEAMIFGRKKRPYSIWRKIESRGLQFDDVADIFAFRVIVETSDDCYRALGVVHQRWRCMPDRFRDFISVPKLNNYRSLHTTVLGRDGRKVELQIRTRDMDRIAEDGVAAHWRYKDAKYGYDAEAAEAAGGDLLERLRPLVEILEHGGDPDEFLEHAKLEMFSDQVFTFTPKGRIIALPVGATPLDFAYAVHSDIGDTCVGAKINGRSRPLRTRLQNGDVVEIVRGGAPAPQQGWEDIAVTGRARSAIRRLVRRAERDDYVRIGRAVGEHAFRREGLKLEEASLADALRRLDLPSEEDLFVELGRGRITGSGLLDAVFPGRERRADSLGADRELLTDDKARLYVRGRGLTPGVGLHFAPCCSPLPGDRIVGILEKDRGLVVHTIDCETLADAGDPRAWLDLGWTAEASARTVSVGRVIATVEHAPGVLAEIAGAVTRSKGNISGVRILKRAPDFFDMAFDIEVVDARHLASIVASMRACPSVVTAERARAGGEDAA